MATPTKTKKAPKVDQNVVAKPKPKNYLNNKDFLAAVIEAKRQDKLTDELATKFMLLVKRYGSKTNFAGYSFNDDMQGVALMTLVKTWRNFNEAASSNPFAYYTQCIKNCFVQQIIHEKNVQNLKNRQLIMHGMNPSLSFIMEQDRDYADKRSYMPTSDTFNHEDFTSPDESGTLPPEFDDISTNVEATSTPSEDIPQDEPVISEDE